MEAHNLRAYLERMGVKQVVHGHTGHEGKEPMTYMNGVAINIDGTMSSGYRSDSDRGFILELP